jgi:hypothetical protein
MPKVPVLFEFTKRDQIFYNPVMYRAYSHFLTVAVAKNYQA